MRAVKRVARASGCDAVDVGSNMSSRARCSSASSRLNRKSRRVARVIGQIQLRGERPAADGLHAHMDVRRPPRVRDRPDRSEPEVAVRVGAIDAVALEVGIALRLRAAVRVVVNRVGVALPDFDDRVGGRLAASINHAAGKEYGHALARTSDRPQQ